MYASFFGLDESPFNNTPDPRFFFPTPDHEEALAAMIYTVQEGKGFMLLTGEAGTGKTLVSKMMLRHFGDAVCSATLNHTIPTVADLMASVCTEFGITPPAGAAQATLVGILHDFLLDRYARNTPVVLIIDEAQALPAEAFEQLRMLSNLEDDQAKLLQTIIVGQQELRHRFQSPSLRQLRQRIALSYHLSALDRPQCVRYIEHRLKIAGAEDTSCFTSDAVEVIHKHAHGLPRLINAVSDNALLNAYSADRRSLDGAFIQGIITPMLAVGSSASAGEPSSPVRVTSPPVEKPTPVPPPAPPATVPVVIQAPPAANAIPTRRLEHLESKLDDLSRAIQHVARRLEETPPPPPPPPTPPSPDPEEVSAAVEQHLAAAVQQAQEELQALVRKTQDRADARLRRMEDRLAGVLQETDALLARGARKTEDLQQHVVRAATSSARHEQEMRRLTSAVGRLAGGGARPSARLSADLALSSSIETTPSPAPRRDHWRLGSPAASLSNEIQDLAEMMATG